MLILKVLFWVIIFIVLFIIFLRHKIEFVFETPDFWRFTFKNILLKYSWGSAGGSFESFIKFNAKHENIEEIIPVTSPKTAPKSEKSKVLPPKLEKIKKEKKVKPQKPAKSTEKIVKEEKAPEEVEAPKTDYLELAKKFWKREEKFVKTILKYIVKLIKISLKLLIPSKIDIYIEGGSENPAETGWLYSVFVLFTEYFEKNKRITLNFAPQFLDPEWKAKGEISYSFSIADLLLFLVLVLITFPYYQVIRCWLRNRK